MGVDTGQARLLLSNILAGEAENPKSTSQGVTQGGWTDPGANIEQGLREAKNERDAYAFRGPGQAARECLLPLL